MTAWTDLTAKEKADAVRPLLREGLTFRVIAERLGTSRTAVAAVAHRNKLTSRSGDTGGLRDPVTGKKKRAPASLHYDNPGRPKQPPAPQPRTPKANRFVFMPNLGSGDSRPAVANAWLPLPGSSPVSIEEHKDGCRWPIGRALPFLFCNEPTAPEHVYCPQHKAIGTRELPPARKSRAESLRGT